MSRKIVRKKFLKVYTDGSCCPNPGNGGWGFIALDGDYEFRISGSAKKTTNNAMELTAIIRALDMFKHYSQFHFYSDSQYVINCASGKWKRGKNIDLWKEYDSLSQNKQIRWTWVKGHNGDYYNELVDKLARDEIRK